MFKTEVHHLLYPATEWQEYAIYDIMICPIDYRTHGSVHTMVRTIKLPSDIAEFSWLTPPESTPSEACEWLARKTKDIETRKDLLAEAYILKMENL